jgi:hypothetical protein
VAQQAGTTRRQTEGEPAARLARWARCAVATATFTVPEGTTEFVCTFHSGMTGTIEGV